MNDNLENWKKACQMLGIRIGEKLEIHAASLRENWKVKGKSPEIKIHMKKAKAGDLPDFNSKIRIPRPAVMDEDFFDANQMDFEFKEAIE